MQERTRRRPERRLTLTSVVSPDTLNSLGFNEDNVSFSRTVDGVLWRCRVTGIRYTTVNVRVNVLIAEAWKGQTKFRFGRFEGKPIKERSGDEIKEYFECVDKAIAETESITGKTLNKKLLDLVGN